MNTPWWIQLIGFLLALSGWGKVVFEWVVSSPRVRGRIFNVLRGNMKNPENPTEELTSFVTYLYLVNTRKNSIHLLDYELEVKLNGKWKKLKRVYGVHNIKNLTFLAPDGKPILIENFSENLIYRKNMPVEYGKPLQGWVMFVGDLELHQAEISSYHVKCIDAYGKKHSFKSSPEKFENLYLLQDMAGISLPSSARK